MAKRSDVVIAFGVRVEGEGFDSADLSLPWGQDAVIAAVASANPNTIVVLETGNPVSMPWRDKVKAIVQAWYPGQAGAQAIAEGGLQPQVLYATDRAPAAPDDEDGARYTDDRGGVLRLGVASIRLGIDESITWEEARRISLLKNRTEEYPLEVESVQEYGPLARTVRPFDDRFQPDPKRGRLFAEAVDRQLARSGRNDVFIYVHGYKVVFENPILVASELWHFLGYQGAFSAFSFRRPRRPRDRKNTRTCLPGNAAW